MGSSTSPKMFSSGALGQSSGDAVTQSQPLATVANPGVPSFSAYNQQIASPAPAATPAPDMAGGDTQDVPANLRNLRRIPFYGDIS